MVSLVAIANEQKVLVFAVNSSKSQLIREIKQPMFNPSVNGDAKQLRELDGIQPSITWGYGHSPVMKDKCYATLVIAWGPLIQMYILNDLNDLDQVFMEDGYIVL